MQGATAVPAVHVSDHEGVAAAVRSWGLTSGRPVLVSVGGAAGLVGDARTAVAGLFAEVVVPLAHDLAAAVVDGGTDDGVMRLLGRARADAGATFPLIGVAAAGTVTGPDAPGLEPHHTGVLLVPGEEWGDEAPWIAATARALAGGRPSATLVVNGGEVTWTDIEASIADARPVLVLAGTGRTADVLAGAAAGRSMDDRAAAALGSGLVRVAPVTEPGAVRDLLISLLS